MLLCLLVKDERCHLGEQSPGDFAAWSPSNFKRKCFRLPSRWATGGGHLAASARLPGGMGATALLRDLPTCATCGYGSLPSFPHLQIEDTCPSSPRTSKVVGADPSQGTVLRGVAPMRPPGPSGQAPRRPLKHGRECTLRGQSGLQSPGAPAFHISGLGQSHGRGTTEDSPQGWCEMAMTRSSSESHPLTLPLSRGPRRQAHVA